MIEVDMRQVAQLMLQNLEELRAFRAEHGERMPTLMNAEDAYRWGGPRSAFRRVIEDACRARRDLEGRIRRVYAWALLPDKAGD